MGQKGKEMVQLDVNLVLADLRKAYLEELQSFFSYWIASLVARGFEGQEIAEHFQKEAMEELNHARRLAGRMLELGGDPSVAPSQWESGAGSPWVAPRANRADASGMIQDQLMGEREAIQAYHRIAQMTLGKDPVTHFLATQLLADEVGHEEFLEKLLSKG